jgi:4-amino-4-deoxy-L-arabinose transferase-like glycosyltransferase
MPELAQTASEASYAAASLNHAAAPVEQAASPTDQPSDGPGDLRRRWPASVVPLVVLIGTAVAVNLWWIDTYRRGLPFDIDEAGYLQRALTDASFLTTGGLGGFLGHLHNPDPQAPLLPAFAAVVHWMTGVGPFGLIATQQFFYVVLLVATWCIARRLGGRMQALAATAVVAAVPGIFEASRTFEFGLVAASMLTAALAAQLWAGRFDRLWPVVAWGVVLGFAALSRTMVLGLLPGLLVALGVRLWAVGLNRRRVGNALLGLGVALVVAWGWYSASWRNVLKYLSNYGYGSEATHYGKSSSVLSLGWWTARPSHAIQAMLFAPTTVLLAFCLIVAVVDWGRRSAARHRGTRHAQAAVRPDARAHSPKPVPVSSSGTSTGLPSRLRRIAAGDVCAVAIVLVWSFFALSSTANLGSGFELTMIPMAVVLVVSAASRSRPATVITTSCCLLTATLVFAIDSSALVTGTPVVARFGSWSVVAFDGRGSLAIYADTFLPGPVPSQASVDAVLRANQRVTEALASLIVATTKAHGRQPVILLATEDPFVNTNSLGLEVQLQTGQQPGMGLVQPPSVAGASFVGQLTEPRFGEPNIVMVGPNATDRIAATWGPIPHPLAVIPALRSTGFTLAGSVRMPDGRTMQVWWKDVGPVLG